MVRIRLRPKLPTQGKPHLPPEAPEAVRRRVTRRPRQGGGWVEQPDVDAENTGDLDSLREDQSGHARLEPGDGVLRPADGLAECDLTDARLLAEGGQAAPGLEVVLGGEVGWAGPTGPGSSFLSSSPA